MIAPVYPLIEPSKIILDHIETIRTDALNPSPTTDIVNLTPTIVIARPGTIQNLRVIGQLLFLRDKSHALLPVPKLYRRASQLSHHWNDPFFL